MPRTRHVALGTLIAMAVVLAAAAAVAQSRLPKLPPAYVFAQTGDSPGAVTFNHESHVDESAPSCTTCHPKLFRILVPGGTIDNKPITHEAMGQGRHCGACHNGKQSFGLDDC